MTTSDNTPLGDRQKGYEKVTRRTLPRRTYTLIRVDGRAFHSYLRGFERPVDKRVTEAMDAVGRALLEEVAGSVFAFVQSDEVSVLAQDFLTLNQEPWFGGVEAKMVSVSASVATAAFNKRIGSEKWGLFDSRVWTMSDPVEVANYFLWRQQDAIRNAIAMTAQTYVSHKELQGVDQEGQLELIEKAGVKYATDLPTGFRKGRVVTRKFGGAIITEAAPLLDARPHGWLAQHIPSLPGLW